MIWRLFPIVLASQVTASKDHLLEEDDAFCESDAASLMQGYGSISAAPRPSVPHQLGRTLGKTPALTEKAHPQHGAHQIKKLTKPSRGDGWIRELSLLDFGMEARTLDPHS